MDRSWEREVWRVGLCWLMIWIPGDSWGSRLGIPGMEDACSADDCNDCDCGTCDLDWDSSASDGASGDLWGELKEKQVATVNKELALTSNVRDDNGYIIFLL